ncbi:MAG: DUF115 domain-containing protein [Spirochaetaceae bacterium]|jgi:hypothetical protein|nr:DUF115 domain-containing protein [Spirochaetaceae bacterium]
MDKHIFFERNLLALSRSNPALCSRLSGAETTLGRYRFVEGQEEGRDVPAWVDPDGGAHTLHSLVSPEREAERLVSTLKGERYVVVLGLGAGYTPEALLAREDTARILVIEYDINALAELLCHYDYIKLFNDPRFFILADPVPHEIEKHILATFQPALHNGIRTLPLRARTINDDARFAPAAEAVRSALDKVASDYSVQALFGKRWFSNIIRNIFTAEKQCGVFAPVKRAAVCAAGPSLDLQLELIARKRKSFFLISTDTALSTLLEAGLPPDAVISIDCQHISYYHFTRRLPPGIPLFLDLSSPPLLTSLAEKTFFFAGGHPLSAYVTHFFRSFPVIDTSGANVTFAALSLAERLGASAVELYGADFSYPKGKLYTRAAYLYPYFHRRQSRLRPAENLAAAFLYDSKSLRRVENGASWYYETRALGVYRQKIEQKADASAVELNAAPGEGAPFSFSADRAGGGRLEAGIFFEANKPVRLLAAGKPLCGAKEFLEAYRKRISELPLPEENITVYQRKLSDMQNLVFTTLLPAAAAIKYRRAGLDAKELLASVKNYCIEEISGVSAARGKFY